MPVLVEVPNVGEIEFPDSLSEGAISEEIRKLTGEEAPKPAAEEEQVTPVKPYPQDFVSQIKRAPGEIALGAGAAGTFLRAAGQDIFNRLVGAGTEPGEMSNIEAAKRIVGERSESLIQGELPPSLQEPRTELPIQQTIRAMPTVPRLAASAGAGLVETAPQMAVVGLEQAAGVPLPVALGGTFGFTPEGKFDPKSAVMAAAIPFVGKYSGELGGLIARKFGVDNATAINVVKGASGLLGPLAGMLAEGEREISKLPEDQKTNARMDLYANLLGQAAFGPIGVKYERKPNASRLQETAKVYGDVRPQPVQGLREVPVKEGGAGVQPRAEEAVQTERARVLLTPEESSHLEAQRGTIEAPVEVVENIPEGDALAANIATIDRKSGKVRINPARFSTWLKSIPEKNRPEAVRSLLSEEQIHLKVSPEQAETYWNNLTAAERMIQRRRYTGSWKGAAVSDTNMGHEAIRFRMQQLARMTPREIAEAVGREKWTLHGITAMEDVLRGLRETIGTTASKEQLAILDRIESGIATAKTVVTGKPEEKPEEPFAAMKPQQVTIERSDGSKYEAEFNGYYDFRAVGQGIKPSIGYTLPDGGLSHGFLKEGEKIVTKIPPFEEEPAARPKKQKETSEQAMMFLPPLRTGEPVSREAFATATPNEISKAAEAHLSGTPDFTKLVGELQSKFGSGINRSQLSDVWQDAVWKKVMQAKGPELERLRDELNLRRTMGSKEVADPGGVRPTQAEDRKVFVARQKYRQQVARAVALKLIGQVRERSKERLFRPALEPDDVAFEKPKAFQEIGTTESQSTPILKRLLREGARLSGEAVSNTRRVVALVNKKTGEVHLVSAYPHGGEGVRIVDPTTTLTGRPNIPLESLPKNFRPIATALIDEPVKNFHQKFASVDEWNAKFADEARSRIQEQASREALLEEGAGVIEPGEAVASVLRTGDRLTNAEAGGVLDHLYNEVSKIESPEDVRLAFEGLADKPNWQVISAYQKMFESLAKKHPDLEPGQVLDLLTNEIYETANQSPTREDFVKRALERYEGQSPETVRAGETTPAVPGKAQRVRAIERGATGRAIARAEQAISRIPLNEWLKSRAGLSPSEYTKSFRPIRQEPGAMPKVKRAAEEAKRSFFGIANVIRSEYARQGTKKNLASTSQAAEVESNRIAEAARIAIGLPSSTAKRPFGNPQVLAAAKAINAVYSSEGRIPPWERTGEYMSGGVSSMKFPNRSLLDSKLKDTIEAEEKALTLRANPSQETLTQLGLGDLVGLSRQQIVTVADKWLEAARKLQSEVKYAQEHFGEPELMNTALRLRSELQEQLRLEREAGASTEGLQSYIADLHDQLKQLPAGSKASKEVAKTLEQLQQEVLRKRAQGKAPHEIENYLQGLYEGDLWGDSGVHFGGMDVLGKNFGKKKVFTDYYDAIKAGPYIPRSYSAADIAAHRIRSGMARIMERQAFEAVTTVNDPATKTPVAIEAELDEGGGYRVPPGQSQRKLVYPWNGGKPLAVRRGYVRLMNNLYGDRMVPDTPIAEAARHANSVLKHGFLLMLDSYHLVKLRAFGASIAGRKSGWRGGWTALNLRPEDMAKAVEQGVIPKRAMDWALETETVNINGEPKTMTHQEIAQTMMKRGLSVGRVMDAIYKHFVDKWDVEIAGRKYGIGAFNRYLFDKLQRGLMLEAAVSEFVRLHRQAPNVDSHVLIDRVNQDINTFFGSMGKTGLIKNPTLRDISQIVFLAPQWVGGRIMSEARMAKRLPTAAYKLVTKGPAAANVELGTLGRAMGRGIAASLVMTQVLNLLTRRKLTFQNDEPDHRLDAWLPDFRGGPGVWISPTSMFAELTHDLVRYAQSKPKVWDAVRQIGENKLSPWGRAAWVLWTSTSPMGEKITTTPGVLRTAGEQIAPVPISLGRLGQAGAHLIAPKLVAEPDPGMLERQLLSSAGIKSESGKTANQQVSKLADEFMTSEGLKKETGFEMVPTDEPSYARLRSALRSGDEAGAKRIYDYLTKTRKPADVAKAMQLWKDRPFTGSRKAETFFQYSLNDAQRELYAQAVLDRQALYRAWVEFYYSQ